MRHAQAQPGCRACNTTLRGPRTAITAPLAEGVVQDTGHAHPSEGGLREHAWATESTHGLITGLKQRACSR